MDRANDCVAPRLPVVRWPEHSELPARDAWNGLCWTTRTLLGRVADRPSVWVDDVITETDHAGIDEHVALRRRPEPDGQVFAVGGVGEVVGAEAGAVADVRPAGWRRRQTTGRAGTVGRA